MGEFVHFPSFEFAPSTGDDMFKNMGMGSRFRNSSDFENENRYQCDQFRRDASDFIPDFGSLLSEHIQTSFGSHSSRQDVSHSIRKQNGLLIPDEFGFSRVRKPIMPTPSNEDQYVSNPHYDELHTSSLHNASEQRQATHACIRTIEGPTKQTVHSNIDTVANVKLHQLLGLQNSVDLVRNSQSLPPQDTSYNINVDSFSPGARSYKHYPPGVQQPKPTRTNRRSSSQSSHNIQQPTPPPSFTYVVPVTPHIETCMIKIQDIQRDIEELVVKLEAFSGVKNDNKYLYFDDILTRNLSKLDRIDIDGNDIIRPIRKEVIKYVLRSIKYLEEIAEHNAKIMENAKTKFMDSTETQQM